MYASLQRQGLVESWHDRMIPAGGRWTSEVNEHLETADVILLLVSADFLNSDYCWDIEMTRALQREAAGSACVIPTVVDHCDWTSAPFAKLQALPPRGKPVSTWNSASKAWKLVAAALRRLAESGASVPSFALDIGNASRYLAWLQEEHSHIDIRGMGGQVAERMELAEVYTQLTVTDPEAPVTPPISSITTSTSTRATVMPAAHTFTNCWPDTPIWCWWVILAQERLRFSDS